MFIYKRNKKIPKKMVELVGGGYVINRAILSGFLIGHNYLDGYYAKRCSLFL